MDLCPNTFWRVSSSIPLSMARTANAWRPMCGVTSPRSCISCLWFQDWAAWHCIHLPERHIRGVFLFIRTPIFSISSIAMGNNFTTYATPVLYGCPSAMYRRRSRYGYYRMLWLSSPHRKDRWSTWTGTCRAWHAGVCISVLYGLSLQFLFGKERTPLVFGHTLEWCERMNPYPAFSCAIYISHFKVLTRPKTVEFAKAHVPSIQL